MSACIYCIENSVNGHCYIGQTIDYVARKSKHLRELEQGKHHNIKLQRAYDKYGADAFKMYILENDIPLDKLGEREDYYIDLMGYYNIAGGRRAFTPTALRNMSEAHIGNISPLRTISQKEVLYILSLDTFLDGIARTVAALSNGRFSREVPKEIINRNTYREISKFYDKLKFEQKILLFQYALKFYNYNPWKNTNCECPKKNAYMLYIIQHTKHLLRQEVADMLQIGKSGLRKVALELRENKRKINTDFDDSQIQQILTIILDEQYRAKFQ